MRFSTEFIDKIISANNIVDLISQYTSLKATGSGFMGRCPFPDHPEKTPSFSVSELKQVFHCFGCQKKGNIFSFLQFYNGMSFVEAVEYLAERGNIDLPLDGSQDQSQHKEQKDKKRQLFQALKSAEDYFHQYLKNCMPSHPAQQFIADRKLNADLVREFKIGYAGEEWEGLLKFLEKKDFNKTLLEEAKLIKKRAQAEGYFDLFRHRVIFPIHSAKGDVVGFGGRILQDGQPKYLNSPESLVFQKSKTLYGLNVTAKYINAEDEVIIVEGYLDFLSLYGAGVKNVVATMGTALTIDHCQMLKRMTKRVVVLFDGDQAGLEASERALPILLAEGLRPRAVFLKQAKDPDEYVHKFGVEKLKDLLSNAKDLFSMCLNNELLNYKSEATEKVRIAEKVQSILSKLADEKLKDLYFEESATRLGVSKSWISKATGSNKTASLTQMKSNVSSSHSRLDLSNQTRPIEHLSSDLIQLKGANKAELLLLQLAIKNQANLSTILQLNALQFKFHDGVRKALEKAIDVCRQNPAMFDRFVSQLALVVDEPNLLFSLNKEELTEVELNEQQKEQQAIIETKMLEDGVKKIKELDLQKQIDGLTREIKIKSDNEKLSRLMDLQKQKLQLKNNL